MCRDSTCYSFRGHNEIIKFDLRRKDFVEVPPEVIPATDTTIASYIRHILGGKRVGVRTYAVGDAVYYIAKSRYAVLRFSGDDIKVFNYFCYMFREVRDPEDKEMFLKSLVSEMKDQ